MIVSGKIEAIRAALTERPGASRGFVPTMGYLHDGHLSLVNRAKLENDIVAVSVYVNPAQFSPTEDLSSYPRDLERDIKLLSELDVDLVFTPDNRTMYSRTHQTSVSVERVAQFLEGKSRPTHFTGVATVVAKLFNIINPDRAYFGQKDAQQCAVIKQMVSDLNFDVEIVICPIIREHDGLAMSSRNVRLSPEDRRAAPVVYQSLLAAFDDYLQGERQAETLRDRILDCLTVETRARVDYVSVADPATMEELSSIERGALISAAVYFGDVRLIDNILLE